MPDMILVVNAGSSSLKFEVFEVGSAPNSLSRAVKGQVEGIGVHPRLSAKDAKGNLLVDERLPAAEIRDLVQALACAQGWLRAKFDNASPVAVGHRVVHGGPSYSAPTLVDDELLTRLERLIPLAPLHQPNNLAPIKALHAKSPALPQVACFDTAFHRGHPELADRFAIPEVLYAEGVRRYGFHGLSYEYIASRLPEVAPEIASGRVIVAHLGSGASMCAMIDGRSVESTMGFTALDGLPMGTRPGQLDAGVVLYLMAEKQMPIGEVQKFLYGECGLKGMSGISSDVRDLLKSADPQAARALDYFAYRIGMLAGSLAAAMRGLDGFVFTAGIGENSPEIRERAAAWLGWLGLELDEAANRQGETLLSRSGSRVRCYAMPTDEELMIGRHTLAALQSRRSSTVGR